MLNNGLKIFTSLLLIFIFYTGNSQAQSPAIDLEIQADPVFTNAQIINLTNLIFDESGKGARLFSLFIQNDTDQVQESLYLDMLVRTQRKGLIVEGFQSSGTPFSLQPGQVLFASNNDLASGRLPGIDTQIRFNGGITSQGAELLNNLQGSTRLPVDEYTLEVRLYQGNNRPGGGNLLVSRSLVIGGDLVDDELSLYLQAPGDVVGTGISITNPYPEFRWEGQQDRTYRIIIVEEKEGEDPETLIQSAKSTSAGRVGSTGSLLEFEMLDFLVEGTSLQFPSSGVQPLRSGNTYYWQVFTSLSSTAGDEERASEIWSFTLGSGFDGQAEMIEIDDELREILIALLGLETYRELEQRDFELERMEVDEREMYGGMARDELLRLAERIRDGMIKISR
jgi:hypothetical protein